MKTGVGWGCVSLLLAVCGTYCLGDPSQQDTVVDNRFEFTQAEYVVAEDATNAVIPVRFYPGNRGLGGSVPYTTEDISATAGEDYTQVSGTLWFSGWGPHFLTVPIIWDDLDEADQTVLLRLIGGGWKTMVGPQATATLRITNVRPPLRLRLAPGARGCVIISWPDNGIACVPEQSANPLSGNWTTVTNATATASGRFFVTNTCSMPATFYRLRKP